MTKMIGRAQHAQLRQRQGAEPRQGFLAGNDVAGPADRHQQHQQVHAAVTGAGGGISRQESAWRYSNDSFRTVNFSIRGRLGAYPNPAAWGT